MFEAREFMRKRLIDKNVNIVVDYIQPKQDQYPEKTCCTVLFNNQNIAQMLIERGFAKVLKVYQLILRIPIFKKVIRHRQDDDNRSPQYDQLVAAEAKAEAEKKGIWADKSADNVLRVIELQGDAQRSKQFLPYLQRSKRINAIVEFVTSASRLSKKSTNYEFINNFIQEFMFQRNHVS
jgi:staphylococcal nuclease domain-containing protein 1